ncbi:hypothetical protein BC834DRAFT_884115 [Gloeopeniophorella convolvens]|nr:hypothetical protein BC834DRAFT_884115 [Gloeopeniophorella convolvens]
MDVEKVRERLEEMDPHYFTNVIKFYFMPVIPPGPPAEAANPPDGTERVRQSRNNVLIETLQAGTLGLPSVAHPILEMASRQIPILHPSILPLTKLKRWCSIYTSTWVRFQTKAASDYADIEYMFRWMHERGLTIKFEEYHGRPKENLMLLVRTYWDKKLLDGADPEEWEEVMKVILMHDDFVEIKEAQEREGNVAEKALGRVSPPPP